MAITETSGGVPPAMSVASRCCRLSQLTSSTLISHVGMGGFETLGGILERGQRVVAEMRHDDMELCLGRGRRNGNAERQRRYAKQ